MSGGGSVAVAVPTSPLLDLPAQRSARTRPVSASGVISSARGHDCRAREDSPSCMFDQLPRPRRAPSPSLTGASASAATELRTRIRQPSPETRMRLAHKMGPPQEPARAPRRHTTMTMLPSSSGLGAPIPGAARPSVNRLPHGPVRATASLQRAAPSDHLSPSAPPSARASAQNSARQPEHSEPPESKREDAADPRPGGSQQPQKSSEDSDNDGGNAEGLFDIVKQQRQRKASRAAEGQSSSRSSRRLSRQNSRTSSDVGAASFHADAGSARESLVSQRSDASCSSATLTLPLPPRPSSGQARRHQSAPRPTSGRRRRNAATEVASMSSDWERPTRQSSRRDELNHDSDTSSSPPLAPNTALAHLFAPRQWLSDACISFVYEGLTRHGGGLGADGQNMKMPDSILLMDPALAFWLSAEKEQKFIDEALRELKVSERDLVLCPVNDSCDLGAADAGSHWGLLVWDKLAASDDAHQAGSQSDVSGRFLYYDSGQFSRSVPRPAKILARCLGGKASSVSLRPCAKQTNSFDCGMYVIVFSEMIVSSRVSEPATGDGDGDGDGSAKSVCTPFWESQLVSLRPEKVTDSRSVYYDSLMRASVAAAAGA